MASIQRQRESRFWYAYYRDALGRQHTVSTKIDHAPDGATAKDRAARAGENRRLAQELAVRLEEAERGNATEAHLRKVLSDISERVNKRNLEFAKTRTYLTDWAGRVGKAKSWRTGERYTKIIRDFIDGLGAKAEAVLSDITARDVQSFIDRETTAGKSGSSIRIAAKVLNIPFNLAMRQGLILKNPVPAVDIPKAAYESRQPFTWPQVQRLLRESAGEWRTAIVVGVFTGARLGDCVAMKWSDVDLQSKMLTFRPSKTARLKKDLKIPLHASLEAHLLSLSAPDNPHAFLTPGLAAQRIPGRSGLSRQFQEIMHKAGIEQETVAAAGRGGRKFNRYGFHSFRHSFVSMLANAGIAPDVRQLLSGHTDEETHIRYSHQQIETLRKAITTIPTIDL